MQQLQRAGISLSTSFSNTDVGGLDDAPHPRGPGWLIAARGTPAMGVTPWSRKCLGQSWPPTIVVVLLAASSYFVIRGLVDAGGVGAGGEITSVSHAFQPEGRSDPSNSP